MRKYLIGVDIGGTKIHAGITTTSGEVLAAKKVPTDSNKGGQIILDHVHEAIKAVWKPGVQGIGVGIAGIVNQKKGVFISGPNLPNNLHKLRIGSWLKSKYKVPVQLDNDVHCFTLAEAEFGSAKGFSNVVGLTFGTGIGGGVILNNKLYRGRHNAAGEIGHMTIAASSDITCSCGEPGHFEALVSGSAMSKLYFKATGKNIDALAVEEAAKQGDLPAVELIAKMADHLAIGIANIVHILNPDIITIGGGLSRVSSLIKPAIDSFKKKLISPALADTKVITAKLGDNAGIIGAAQLVNN
jgi:glucokinase